ncbi:MAG TPA: DUF362 domain-containing protein [Candidatus Polarisedimenticolia bacterium]|nr:DUF362 domain-containing protein [Candidatus Polarisedimenticolia bacterium]
MPVHFESVGAYRVDAIESAVERSLDRLGVELSGRRSAFLKPNIVRPAKPSSAVVTHPAVTEAVIRVLRRRGLTDIRVGEASSVGVDVEHAFDVSGYRAMAQRLGVPLLNLNDVERRELKWMFGRLRLPRVALDSDLYINLPKMKTHFHTTVTLGVKNQKGLLLPEDKQFDHLEVRLHPALAEYARLARPHLTIIDGIVGMEGEGPTKGVPKETGVLAIGDDIYETDFACARFMGVDPTKVAHLAYAVERGLLSLPGGDAAALPVTGEAFEARRSTFDLPKDEPKKIMNFYGWMNHRACAECEHAVEHAFQLAARNPRYWFNFVPKMAWLMMFDRVDLLRGREAKVPQGHGKLLLVGDCTQRLASEYGVDYVKGCVPKPEDVIRRVLEM